MAAMVKRLRMAGYGIGSEEAAEQGGEQHTFTEVKAYGNGFLPPLNPGSSASVIPECQGGFKNIAVARTRAVQGSRLDVTGLSKGKHLFECCIHPWMRMRAIMDRRKREQSYGSRLRPSLCRLP